MATDLAPSHEDWPIATELGEVVDVNDPAPTAVEEMACAVADVPIAI